MDFEKMKAIQPALGTIEREVIARNEEAKENEVYWSDVWAEIKPALQTVVGAYCDNVELQDSTHWNTAVNHFEGIVTNMK